jgi:hypothetical protein
MSTLHSFCWYELRTTDPNAARAFYAEIAGWQVDRSGQLFHAGKHPVGGLLELPERARALGAPAHWLGHIAVANVDATAQQMVALGAQVLGPGQQAGGRVAVLRDPQGAVLALSSRGDAGSREGIAWHELHTTDHEKAWSTYADLFGWQATEALDLGPALGQYQMFSWASGDRSAGGMVSSARAPHIHTHWLFYLTVTDLDASLAKARSLGGAVLNGPTPIRSGDRIAQLEDPQGAAFGLYQYAANAPS